MQETCLTGSFGVQIPRDTCTRFGRYLHSTLRDICTRFWRYLYSTKAQLDNKLGYFDIVVILFYTGAMFY